MKILFSLIYLLIFSAYYVAAGGFLTVLYPQEAFIAFSIFYGVYSFTSLFTSFLLQYILSKKFGFKIILFFSCLSFNIYVAFIGSNISILLYIGAVICGIGNAFIWNIQGIYLDDKDIGSFYMFFNINLILGNILALIVLLAGTSPQIMIFVMLVFTVSASILIFFLENYENKNIKIDNPLKIFKKGIKYFWLIPLMIFQGVTLNITYQIIPKYLLATISTTEILSKNVYICIFYIIYGIFSASFSYLFGMWVNKYWLIITIIYTFLEIICIIGIQFLSLNNHYIGIWLIFAPFRGIIDVAVNTLLNIFLCQIDKDDIAEVFGFFRCVYAVSYLITSILIGYIPFMYILIIDGVICLISSICVFIFKRKNMKVDLEN